MRGTYLPLSENTAVCRRAVLTLSARFHRAQVIWLRACFLAVNLLKCIVSYCYAAAGQHWTALFEAIFVRDASVTADLVNVFVLAVLAIFGDVMK